jgi:GNAT superfamily N-acetyltransferase
MDQSLADLVHRNLMAVNSWMGEADGGALHLAGGELFFASPIPLALFNGVMRDRSGEDASELLSRAQRFFFDAERDFVVYCWPGDPELERAAGATGMVPVLERYPEMVCRSRLPRPSADVRPVEELADAEAYWEICDAAYPSLGFPAGVFRRFPAEHLLRRDRVWACLAREHGQPVACASISFAGEVGTVCWVAALPRARGRGFAAACTSRVTNHALDLGVDVVSLQASPMGEGLYRRLGYEELFCYRLLGAAAE